LVALSCWRPCNAWFTAASALLCERRCCTTARTATPAKVSAAERVTHSGMSCEKNALNPPSNTRPRPQYPVGSSRWPLQQVRQLRQNGLAIDAIALRMNLGVGVPCFGCSNRYRSDILDPAKIAKISLARLSSAGPFFCFRTRTKNPQHGSPRQLRI
jgi:hypothetical protein